MLYLVTLTVTGHDEWASWGLYSRLGVGGKVEMGVADHLGFMEP